MAARWSPPADLGAAIERELARPDIRQLDTPRDTIEVDGSIFRRRLRRELRSAGADVESVVETA